MITLQEFQATSTTFPFPCIIPHTVCRNYQTSPSDSLSLSLCALITFCRSISRKIYANSRSYFLHVVESPRDSWKFTSSGELERETRPRNREPSCPVALEAANYFRAASVDGQRNQRERKREEKRRSVPTKRERGRERQKRMERRWPARVIVPMKARARSDLLSCPNGSADGTNHHAVVLSLHKLAMRSVATPPESPDCTFSSTFSSTFL